MLLCFSLGFALLMSSCCGNAGNQEEESITVDYDYLTTTADYDYTATFDYYFVTGFYSNPELSNKVRGDVAQPTPIIHNFKDPKKDQPPSSGFRVSPSVFFPGRSGYKDFNTALSFSESITQEILL
ncbi:hypothetical protein PAMP_002482 [Pampus punctatissimus]